MKPTLCLYLLPIVGLTIAGCLPASSAPVSTKMVTYIPALYTPSLTPKATTTLTPPATLDAEQAKERIRTLLLEPVDCSAPCFWDIVPGQTTLDEAKNVFTNLGLSLKYTNTLNSQEFYESTYDFNSGLSVSPLLAIQRKIVVNITLYITPEMQRAGGKRAWSAYSPEMLIARYGKPSRVDFALDWGPRSFFDIVLRFDSVDLIVEYTGYDIIPRQKGSPQVCLLTAQFDSIRLWMGKDPYMPPHEAVPLEKATSITMEEFSRLMTGDPSKACFVVNGEVFP